MHTVEHLLGLDGKQIYNLLSGLIPCLLGASFFGAWWRRHKCHRPGCPRIQFHTHPVDGFVVCRHHHPNNGAEL